MTDSKVNPPTVTKGDICHLDLPVEDRERAKGFYGEVFGWSFQEMPEMSYTLFQTPGQNVGGGLFEPNEQMPKQIVDYLYVDSIEDASAAIERHGGKLLGPVVEVPGYGSLRHFLDTEGNHLAIWASND